MGSKYKRLVLDAILGELVLYDLWIIQILFDTSY
jgi:hypothetical protein